MDEKESLVLLKILWASFHNFPTCQKIENGKKKKRITNEKRGREIKEE